MPIDDELRTVGELTPIEALLPELELLFKVVFLEGCVLVPTAVFLFALPVVDTPELLTELELLLMLLLLRVGVLVPTVVRVLLLLLSTPLTVPVPLPKVAFRDTVALGVSPPLTVPLPLARVLFLVLVAVLRVLSDCAVLVFSAKFLDSPLCDTPFT